MDTINKLEFQVPVGWELTVCDSDALDPEKQDSVWYSTGDCYRILELTNGTDTYYIYAVGDVRISHKDYDYVAKDYARLLKWGITTDTLLVEADKSGLIEFHNNNWFEVCEVKSGEWSEYIGNDFQDMIDHTINDYHPWVKSNL
jgi:hypothetical protein